MCRRGKRGVRGAVFRDSLKNSEGSAFRGIQKREKERRVVNSKRKDVPELVHGCQIAGGSIEKRGEKERLTFRGSEMGETRSWPNVQWAAYCFEKETRVYPEEEAKGQQRVTATWREKK